MNKLSLLLLLLMTKWSIAQKLTEKVDVFLGTGGHGHTYPGATVPFGMIQLSPDNGREGWDWSSGYHYSSDTIAGFSHTHLSGTGIGDWCDISVMPFLKDSKSIRSSFSHKNEKARPGYYKVRLDNNILCEMTAGKRLGYHRYQFPSNEGWLQFDMGFHINWDQPIQGNLSLVNDSTLIGWRFSTGWAKNQRVFFAARFSRSATAEATNSVGPTAKLQLKFFTNGKPLLVKVAISSVSYTKAIQELENYHSASFDQTADLADKLWEAEMRKIYIEADRDFETKFYTAFYHSCLAPVLHSDTNGEYRNQDNIVHRQNADKYTVFSLGDTFRGQHPLFTLTQPERLPDMLNSLLSFYDDNGLLPVWDLSTWEANTMTGYHAVPVLADAILKGIKGFDVAKAYNAMLKSASQKQRGTPDYVRFGYLPQDKHGWSVSITLEYAFDDWCIAQVAKKLGKNADYETFMKRSRSYMKLFDPTTGFMRAKDSVGNFIEPFDPLLSEHGFEGQYIEGTAWQHSFFVPHDVAGLAKIHGGREKLSQKLDTLFSTTEKMNGENVSADVTGLLGQYAHGNEPSHHIIYMYTLLGKPAKAAEQILRVVDSLYKSGPDGLAGNDDCGQMSAWLVWTSLGMYPVNPASGEYVFGYPLVKNATIKLPNGKKLVIKTTTIQTGSASIRKVTLNGREIREKIMHSDILNGGILHYSLTK